MDTTDRHHVLTIAAMLVFAVAAMAGWLAYYATQQEKVRQQELAQEEQERLNDRIAGLGRELSALGEQHRALVEEHSELSTRWDRLRNKHDTIVSVHKDLKKVYDISLLKQHELSTELDTAYTNFSALEERHGKVKATRDRLNTELQDALSVHRHLKQDLDTTVSQREQLKAQLNSIVTEFNDLKNTQTQTHDRLLQANELANRLRDKQERLKTEIMAANEAISEKQRAIENAQVLTDTLRAKLKSASIELHNMVTRLHDLEEQRRLETERFAQLRARLESELQERKFEIKKLEDRLTVIDIAGEILFNTGSVRLRPSGTKVLDLIADVLNAYPRRRISIEGHSDAVPVGNDSKFRSNWELSAARAAAAARYLQNHADVDPTRLVVVGHAEHRPVATNDTEQGRAANRRIEIMLMTPVEQMRVSKVDLLSSDQ